MVARSDVRESILTSTPDIQAAARYEWPLWARPDQLEPEGPHRYFMACAGRGWGKTRAGTEWVRAQIESGRTSRAIIVAATASDLRDTLVEGPSGLLTVCPPWDRPLYEPSKRRLTWKNGATVGLYSSEEPDRLRGVNADLLLADELAAWKYPSAWDMALFALRLGNNPRAMVTTTPRPTKIIRELLNRDDCVVVRGSTYDNAANLAPQFIEEIVRRYEGTRLGRQEIHAEVLDDVDGAVLTREQIEILRVDEAPDLGRIIVGVDPAISSGENSDHTGIVVVGKGVDGDLYALADRSCRLGPAGWARRVIDAYREFEADTIVVEKNQGGAMCEHTIRSVDENVPITMVTATRGKHVRAQPILSLFEQSKAHTLPGMEKLEDQLASFSLEGYEADGSPDSADAFVWAATELTTSPGAQVFV
jgi:phage terminase large subunit-like protein